MWKKVIQLVVFPLLMLVFCFSLSALTKEQVAEIALQNTPPKIVEWYNFNPNSFYEIAITDPLKMINMHLMAYLEFQIEGDDSKYLLIAWHYDGEVFLRLFKSTDGIIYALYQDFPNTYAWHGAKDPSWSVYLRQERLTGNEIPEILMTDLPSKDTREMVVFQWRYGKLVDIAQEDNYLGTAIIPKFTTSVDMQVVLNDLDEDGKAEIIVYPYAERQPIFADTNKPVITDEDIIDWDWVFDGPLKIYKYDGSFYALWQEIPFSFDDPYPISVPAIGAFHPSTIPFSELDSPGNGKITIFVSHPAKNYTVDDIDTTKFTYKGSPVFFKKKWKNNNYPDTALANQEWQGCPVRQVNKQGQGEWQINPSDPAILAPDGEMEYHFVGSYLEFELSRSLIFPVLLTRARQFFARETEKQSYYEVIQFSGKMKNGKLLSVSALVCIKKTGNSGEAAKTEKVEQTKSAKGAEQKK